jgi:hypothetical protein
MLSDSVMQNGMTVVRSWRSDNLNTTQTPECSKGMYNAKIIKQKSLLRCHESDVPPFLLSYFHNQ